jgi:hypothetical protein
MSRTDGQDSLIPRAYRTTRVAHRELSRYALVSVLLLVLPCYVRRWRPRAPRGMSM